MQCVILLGGPALPSLLGAITFQLTATRTTSCCRDALPAVEVVPWILMTLNFGAVASAWMLSPGDHGLRVASSVLSCGTN